MKYDFNKRNYSIRGSYLTVRQENEEICVITARKWDDLGVHEVCRIRLPGSYSTVFDESQLEVAGEDTRFSLCLVGKDNLRIRGSGNGFTLTQREYQNIYVANFAYEKDGGIHIGNWVNNCTVVLTPLRGRLTLDAPKTTSVIKHDYIHINVQGDDNGEFEIALEQFLTPSLYRSYVDDSYDSCVARNLADYRAWEKPFDCETDAEREAVYVMWSNIVEKDSNFVDDAMLMSKSGMIAVWSWDNCINALGLAKAHPQFALSQFLFPYRYMDAFGCMPDAVYEWKNAWVYVKPPIQGWIYRKLVKSNGYFSRTEVIAQIYPFMKRNTEWWLNFRGPTPYYNHGNDSGADDATCFDTSEQIQTGELLALLSVQCGVLADMAKALGLPADRETFSRSELALRKKSVDDFFDGRLFVRRLDTLEPVYSQSLLPYRIIVLEDDLPDCLKAYIVESLKEKYITPYGVASEPVDSPEYIENGYWRGAIWPPDQVIILLSLAGCGEGALARKVAADYRANLQKNGFYENASALTGRGLRCTGYTWTPCAYFALKNLLG